MSEKRKEDVQEDVQEEMTIGFIGNPNCGKTTIFNILTGTHQHVGNYSGVTVERKTGICRMGDFIAYSNCFAAWNRAFQYPTAYAIPVCHGCFTVISGVWSGNSTP